MAPQTPVVRDRVLSLFESVRKAKGAPYEPQRFQAFLTEPPQSPNRTIYRSRFVRFMNSVEEEFGFCFTREEWEERFSLDEFVSRIEKKVCNPDQARRFASARFARARRLGLNQLILQIFLATGVFVVAVISIRMAAVRFVLVALWAGLVTTFVYSWFKDCGHLKRILDRARDAMG